MNNIKDRISSKVILFVMSDIDGARQICYKPDSLLVYANFMPFTILTTGLNVAVFTEQYAAFWDMSHGFSLNKVKSAHSDDMRE